MLSTLHHVGVLVPSLDAAVDYYSRLFGERAIGPELRTADGHVRIVFVETGSSLIELLEPLPAAAALRSFLDSHPDGGLHHLCYAVPDIMAAWQWFEERGATFVSPVVPGVLSHPIFFVQPVGACGVLTEIIEITEEDG